MGDDSDLGLRRGVGRFFWCLCLGSAQANISAMPLIETRNNLVTVQCQSQGFSLVVKHVMKRVFADFMVDAEAVISFVRHHNRVSTLLNEISGGKDLFRVVDVRFGTWYVAAKRLVEMRVALRALLTHETFAEYTASADSTIKAKIEAFENTLTLPNKRFIERANQVVDLLAPPCSR